LWRLVFDTGALPRRSCARPSQQPRRSLSFVTAAATNRSCGKELAGRKRSAHSFAMPVNQELTPERIAELQRMTPEQKWNNAQQMYWDARRAQAVEVQAEHPDWSEPEVQSEVKRIFLSEAMKEG
jgi:hypothetical protein